MPKRDRWSSDEEEEEKERTISSPTPLNAPVEHSDAADTVGEDKRRPPFPPPGFRVHNPLLNGCRSVYDAYERLSHLDEGTYGIVWKARDKSTDEIVALKQIKFDSELVKEGFPISALREIGVLLSLSQENIVTVREMVVGSATDKVFMVMECMEMDLQTAMKKGAGASTPFAQSEVKSMMHQILSGMAHVHERWFLHRDIKTSNILVHKTGRLALCDFGLARKYETPPKQMTQMVVTLWYRAPEVLFGEARYGPALDLWSVGCVFGELLIKDALLKGAGGEQKDSTVTEIRPLIRHSTNLYLAELDQIQKIFKLLGTPTEADWPEFSSLPSAGTFKWKSNHPPGLRQTLAVNSFSATGQSYLDPNGFDLLTQLLALNPRKRISAEAALDHAYFREGVKMQTPQFFM